MENKTAMDVWDVWRDAIYDASDKVTRIREATPDNPPVPVTPPDELDANLKALKAILDHYLDRLPNMTLVDQQSLAQSMEETLKVLKYRIKREKEYRRVVDRQRRREGRRGELPDPTKGDVRGL